MSSARYLARWEVGDVGGAVVVVDVLRAFTTAAYALAAGAREIRLVAGVDEAIALGRSIPGSLVMGEEDGRRPPGFDLSNSPVDAAAADVDGRVLVQRTSAGTQGAVAAVRAERLFATGLATATATAAAVSACGLGAPTYVITGRFPDQPEGGLDDLLTARFIEDVRLGAAPDPAEVAAAVAATERRRPAGARCRPRAPRRPPLRLRRRPLRLRHGDRASGRRWAVPAPGPALTRRRPGR